MNQKISFKSYFFIAIFFIVVFLGSFSYASAADRYWVTGGTGNWNSTSNWASTSGGGSGVSIPTNTDNCYFDANSGSGTSTINASSACADLNFTGFTGTIAGSSALEVKGSFTAVQTMTWTYTGAITFTSTSTGKNIAFAGSAETFSYKRTITINHTEVINTDQTDFPILISGTYSYLKTVANGGNVQNANGYDIGFYSDSSLTTKLKWETERYVATTGEVIYWVKIPTLATATDTVIYMAYGNSSITTDQSDKANVWNSAYKGVWHLPDGTSLTTLDSTSNAYDGTNTGSVAAATGNIGGGADFPNDSSKYINNETALITAPPATISAWVNFTSVTSPSYGGIFEIGGGGSGAYSGMGIIYNTTGGLAHLWANENSTNGGANSAIGTTTLSSGVWYYATAVFNSSSSRTIYLNGVAETTGTTSATVNPSYYSRWRMGRRATTTTQPFNGIISNVTLSNVARSADWIATEYNNQSSPSSFYTIGSATSSIVTASSVTFNGTGGGWTLTDSWANTTGDITLIAGTLDTNSKTVRTNNFIVSGSTTRTLTLGASTIILAGTGGWDATTTTNLTFNSNTSTIKYIDSSSTGKTFIGGGLTYYMLEEATGSTGALTITGSNTFQGIYINGSSRTLKFTAGTTTTFTSGGTGITTTGTGLTITSATSATHTLTKSSGTVTVQNTTISYSTAQGGAIWDSLVSANNVDGGNNSGWRFGINVSGTANGNNGAVVKVAINGTVQAQTATISGGAWTISNMTIPTTNDIVTAWIDGVTDANESTGVTKWSAGNITGMVLDTNVLTIGSNQNTSLTIDELGLCDYDTGCSDEDIMHTSNSGLFGVQASSNSYTGEVLSVIASNAISLTTSQQIITEKVVNAGTITMGNSSALFFNGTSGTLFTNSGTFTPSTSSVVLQGNGDATINSGSINFYNLTSGGSGTKTLGSNITLNAVGVLNVSAGTFDPATYMITGYGSNTLGVANGATIKVNASTFDGNYSSGFTTRTLSSGSTVDYSLAGTQFIDNTLSYSNLNTSGAGAKILGGNTTVSNVMTIGSGSTLGLSAYNLTLSGSVGTPFIVTGTLSSDTGTVTYAGNNGAGSTTIIGTTYYNLTINNSFETSYVLGGAITGNSAGTLTITNGTLDTTGSNYGITFGKINIANSATATLTANASTISLNGTSGTLFTKGASGTFTAGTSTVNLTGNGDATVNSGSPTFYNLITSGTGTKTLGAAITIDTNGTLTVSAGTFDPATYLITGTATNTLSVANGATIKINASTFDGNYSSGFTTRTLSSGSTVDYSLAGTQTIDNTLSYSNLNTSGAGTKTLGGDTTVAKVATIGSSSTLGLSSYNLTLSGTTGTPFVVTGTFTPNLGTVIYTGNNSGGNTTVAGTNYYHLTINNSAETYVLGGAITGNSAGTLTITNGTLDTTSSNYDIIFGKINIANTATAGLTANGSIITLNETTGTLFTKGASGVFTAGTSTVYIASGASSWTQQTGSGSRTWRSIASSADGARLAAVVYVTNNYIYTSTDSGVTWTQQTNPGQHSWSSITSSTDGLKLAATDGNNGYIYTSSDGGVTWTTNSNSSGQHSWTGIASSSDGTKLVAVADSDYIYTSTDSGVTWSTQGNASGPAGWTSVASSADGTKLVASVYNGYIYTSANSGATWSTNSGSLTWYDVASSSDGTKLSAVNNAGYIYTSTNSGSSWTQQTGSGIHDWESIASSDNGKNLVASASGDYIMTSIDYGVTWTEQTSAGARNWKSVASSADGVKFVGGAYTGYVYTYAPSSATQNVTVASGTPSFYNLTSYSAGTKSLGEALTVTGALSLSAGTFDTTSGNNYTVNAGTIVINGGTFTPQASTVNVTGTSGILFTKSSGTFTAGTSTIDMTGNGSATVASGTPSFYNLTSSGTGTKSLRENLTVTGGLTVSGGTFDTTSSYTATGSGTNALTVNNGGTIKVQHSTFAGTYPSFETVTLNTGSTVDYALAGAQTIDNTITYANLNTSGNGTKTLGGDTTGGILTIGATSTLAGSSYTLTLSGTGNVFTNSGTYTADTSTIKLTDSSSNAKTLALGGGTYNNIWLAPGNGTGSYTITGSNTFNDFKDDGTGAHDINFTAGTTTTISSLTLDTNASSRISLKSTSPNSYWYLVDASGTNTVSYVSIEDSCASGGASWIASDGTSVDVNHNCGWVFFVGSRGGGSGSAGGESSATPQGGVTGGEVGGGNGGAGGEGSGDVGTCADGIRNGDETGVDSGGRCAGGGGQGGGGGGDLGFTYTRSMLASAGSINLKNPFRIFLGPFYRFFN